MSTCLSQIPDRDFAAAELRGVFGAAKTANICKAPIDPAAVLNKILSNGECGCRGEDGDQ